MSPRTLSARALWPLVSLLLTLSACTAIIPVASPTPNTQHPTPIQSAVGPARFLVPDASTLLDTREWGEVAGDQLGILLEPGLGGADAERIARELGASVVGEFAYAGLYQLRTSVSTEEALRASLERAASARGVLHAFPMQRIFPEGAGEPGLGAPTYSGEGGRPYAMIGVERAWELVRTREGRLSPVHVGIVDDGLYRGTGEFSGRVQFETASPLDELPSPMKGIDGTENPYGSHGTAIAAIIAADPDNGGLSGIASVLGEKLLVSMANRKAPRYATSLDSRLLYPGGPGNGKSWVMGSLLALAEEVERGATIVNGSWGNSQAHPGVHAAYRTFFERMARERPEVLFVFSAGNDGRSLRGVNRVPGGASLPNVITVGCLENDGARASYSNTSGEDYEVTLAAPGHLVPFCLGADGTPHAIPGGTSMATPQVTAAAALLRSLNPSLSADDLKRVLTDTASREVASGQRTTPVEPGLGGRVLRVDRAVERVIEATPGR